MSLPSKDILAKYISKAIDLGKGRNFKQSVELVIVLKDVDIKSQQLKIREVVYLPKGRGKEAKVCVVCDPDIAEGVKEAGAHRIILSTELRELNKKQAKKIASECDWILVKPDLMGTVGRVLGPALGPRGKIPVPLPSGGAVKALVSRYKNTVLVRIKDQPVIMTIIGSEDMNPEDLAENAIAVLSAIESKLPARFANIGKLIFKTTMGIPVEVSL
ncbi:MAG: 50S ribosomal protein L1 [Desulfurococcaceae archaeon]